MYMGLGGAVTDKGAKRAAKVLAAVPHDRALRETDGAYMAPEPVRGTRNDSRNIAHVAAYIGTIWDMDAQAVLDQLLAEGACFQKKDLAVNGRDMLALGLRGREIGRALDRCLEAVLTEQLPNQREALLGLVKGTTA